MDHLDESKEELLKAANELGLRNEVEVPFGLEAIMKECWQTAEDHGWHSEPRTFGDEIALMHSELSEALEEFRNGKPVLYHEGIDSDEQDRNDIKPEGVASELADVLIRIFDSCVSRDIPLLEALEWKMAYNKTRPYRHGEKKL